MALLILFMYNINKICSILDQHSLCRFYIFSIFFIVFIHFIFYNFVIMWESVTYCESIWVLKMSTFCATFFNRALCDSESSVACKHYHTKQTKSSCALLMTYSLHNTDSIVGVRYASVATHVWRLGRCPSPRVWGAWSAARFAPTPSHVSEDCHGTADCPWDTPWIPAAAGRRPSHSDIDTPHFHRVFLYITPRTRTTRFK